MSVSFSLPLFSVSPSFKSIAACLFFLSASFCPPPHSPVLSDSLSLFLSLGEHVQHAASLSLTLISNTSGHVRMDVNCWVFTCRDKRNSPGHMEAAAGGVEGGGGGGSSELWSRLVQGTSPKISKTSNHKGRGGKNPHKVTSRTGTRLLSRCCAVSLDSGPLFPTHDVHAPHKRSRRAKKKKKSLQRRQNRQKKMCV